MEMENFQVETSQGVWKTDDGKLIPYSKAVYRIAEDEISHYYIEITRWPKNATIAVSIIIGDRGIDDEWETRSLTATVYRIAKLPHNEFDSRKSQLIEQAMELIRGWVEVEN